MRSPGLLPALRAWSASGPRARLRLLGRSSRACTSPGHCGVRRTSCATSRRPLFLPGQSLRQYSRCAGSAGASSESTGPMSVVQAPFGGVAGGGGLRRRAASGRSQGGRRRRWRKAESVRRSCVALQIVVFSSAGDIHPPLPPCIRWLSCIHCHIRVDRSKKRGAPSWHLTKKNVRRSLHCPLREAIG